MTHPTGGHHTWLCQLPRILGLSHYLPTTKFRIQHFIFLHFYPQGRPGLSVLFILMFYCQQFHRFNATQVYSDELFNKKRVTRGISDYNEATFFTTDSLNV